MDEPTTLTPSLWSSLNSWFTSTVFFILLNLMIATIVFTSNLPNNNNNNNNDNIQQDDNDQQQEQENNQNQNPKQNIARSTSILNRLKSFNFSPQKTFQETFSENHYQPQPIELAATQYVFNPPLDFQHFDQDLTNPSNPDPNLDNNINGFTNFTPNNFTEPPRAEIFKKGDVFESVRQEPVRPEQVRQEQLEHVGSDVLEQDKDMDELESLDEVYNRLKMKTGRHDRTQSAGNNNIRSKPAAKMKKSASLRVGFSPEEENVEVRRPATVKERRSAKVDEEDDGGDDVEVDSRADDFINKFKNDLKLQRIESIMKTTKGQGGVSRGGGR